MLLQIENMRDRQAAGQLPSGVEIPIVSHTATTAEVRFTERSTQDLFDDIYNAKTVERWGYKWPKDKKGKPTKEVRQKKVLDARGKRSIINQRFVSTTK